MAFEHALAVAVRSQEHPGGEKGDKGEAGRRAKRGAKGTDGETLGTNTPTTRVRLSLQPVSSRICVAWQSSRTAWQLKRDSLAILSERAPPAAKPRGSCRPGLYQRLFNGVIKGL